MSFITMAVMARREWWKMFGVWDHPDPNSDSRKRICGRYPPLKRTRPINIKWVSMSKGRCDERQKIVQAVFNETIVQGGPLNHQCNFVKCATTNVAVIIFRKKSNYRKKRAHHILNIPPERRTLRANIEATVSEYRRTMPDGKVKVRADLRLCSLRFATGKVLTSDVSSAI